MNILSEQMKPVMKQIGFRVKKNSFYRISGDFIQVINFQKSMWGNLYYINVGFDWITSSDGRFPSNYQYPPYYTLFWRRIEDFHFGHPFPKVFDFDGCSNQETNYCEICSIITELISYLDKNNTAQAFDSLLKSGIISGEPPLSFNKTMMERLLRRHDN